MLEELKEQYRLSLPEKVKTIRSLLNDLLRQLEKEKTGAYQAPYYFSEAAESY